MRKNASKASLTQAEVRQQLIQQANQASEKFKDSEYAEEFLDELTPSVRSEVAPPQKPVKTRFTTKAYFKVLLYGARRQYRTCNSRHT
jgi:hypothetical protein